MWIQVSEKVLFYHLILCTFFYTTEKRIKVRCCNEPQQLLAGINLVRKQVHHLKHQKMNKRICDEELKLVKIKLKRIYIQIWKLEFVKKRRYEWNKKADLHNHHPIVWAVAWHLEGQNQSLDTQFSHILELTFPNCRGLRFSWPILNHRLKFQQILVVLKYLRMTPIKDSVKPHQTYRKI